MEGCVWCRGMWWEGRQCKLWRRACLMIYDLVPYLVRIVWSWGCELLYWLEANLVRLHLSSIPCFFTRASKQSWVVDRSKRHFWSLSRWCKYYCCWIGRLLVLLRSFCIWCGVFLIASKPSCVWWRILCSPHDALVKKSDIAWKLKDFQRDHDWEDVKNIYVGNTLVVQVDMHSKDLMSPPLQGLEYTIPLLRVHKII